MKVVIANIYENVISKEIDIRIKLIIKIGVKNILLYIKKIYLHYDFNTFIILAFLYYIKRLKKCKNV